MKHYLPSKIVLLLSLVPSALFTALILYAAFDHNPQGEFYDPSAGGLQWETVIPLGGIAFAEAYLVSFVLFYVMERLWKAEHHLLGSNETHRDRGPDQ